VANVLKFQIQKEDLVFRRGVDPLEGLSENFRLVSFNLLQNFIMRKLNIRIQIALNQPQMKYTHIKKDLQE
jgi:hypothetical protein